MDRMGGSSESHVQQTQRFDDVAVGRLLKHVTKFRRQNFLSHPFDVHTDSVGGFGHVVRGPGNALKHRLAV